MAKIIDKVINKLHWSLLLIFVIGYFITSSYFDYATYEYLHYNILIFVASAVLFSQLSGDEYRNPAVWLSFTILITVYFIRSYWITIDPTPVKVMLPWNPYFDMLEHKSLLLYAFKISTIMFISFCIFSAFLLYFFNKINYKKQSEAQTSLDTYSLIEKVLWVSLPPLVLVLYFLTHHFQIGLMGAPSGEPLPFRLKGVVFYASTVFIPLLIALLINSAEKCGHKLSVNLGILFMIAHGIVLMLLRGSRSSLLLSLLLLIFMVIVGALKLQRNQKLLIFIFILLAFFMVPVMTIYRNLRIEQGADSLVALTQAILIINNNWLGSVLKGVEFVLFRMPGIESLWCMLAQGAQPLGHQILNVFSSNNGVAGYLTYSIYPLKPTDNTLLAPGYVGWFYLVAGLPGAILSGAAAALIAVIGWIFMNSKFLRSKMVAKVFLLWMLFVALTEGTLDIMGLLVLSGIVCIVFIECMIRLFALVADKKSSS